MSLPAKLLRVTPEEYLALEEKSAVRHELVGGQLFAMAGASEAHNVIALNIATILRTRLRGTGCRTFIFDMKAKVERTEDFYYPDVMATCEKFVAKSLFKSNPFLLVEVLSPSTAHIDRREKLSAYRQIESVREYVIVYQDYQRVELFRKDDTGNWQFAVLGVGDKLLLESLPGGPLLLTMEDIYEDVSFAESPDESL
ncbi:MAG: Uma2 family endonuclease [Blastocatellia bacterium]